MTNSVRKRVWILGAGFSRSLGGPLMGDLLSVGARRQILATYPQSITRDDADRIFWLFHYGSSFPDGPLDPRISERGEHRWRDAEHFLEILDNAHSDSTKAAIVDDVYERLQELAQRRSKLIKRSYPRLDPFRTPKPTMDELAKVARRIIAASCCTFLEGITRENARLKERWLPYQQWLGLLRENDSIFTFNYDRVIELLMPTVGESVWGVHVQGVEDTPSEVDDEDRAQAAKLPSLYKLHGSVNWNFQHNRVSKLQWNPKLLDSTFNLAIATPGDSKMAMSGGIFNKLWVQAAAALRDADDVFIIGFRFPPSDAFPRDKLLNALRTNDKHSLNVEVVLGPEQNSDLRRVLALLQYSVGVRATYDTDGDYAGRVLIARSLWAEDFLNVWSQLEVHRLKVSMPTTGPL